MGEKKNILNAYERDTSVGAKLTSVGKMSQRVGTTAEKACLRCPIRWNALADRIQNILLLWGKKTYLNLR